MKIFKDQELKNEIIELDLGILEAGESKKYIYYIWNDSKAQLLNLVFFVDNQEVKIVKYPEKLEINESSILVIEWKPSITLKEGLKANLSMKGKELWG